MTRPRKLPVIEAITGRRSIRRFLPTHLEESAIRAVLNVAGRAASGTNIQPWFVHVVTGRSRERLSKAVLAAAARGETSLEYPYLPAPMGEPYISRRRKVGYELYALSGIERDNHGARKAAMLRNFEFFGAPVGLFFTIERAMTLGSWIDCGMFMQNVMLAAQAFGLATCAQQAWCDYGAIVHRELGIGDDQVLLSGMALGVADMSATENMLVTERASVDEFATWHL